MTKSEKYAERRTIYFGEEKIDKFETYCKRTGRKLSPLVVRAVEEYISRNPPR